MHISDTYAVHIYMYIHIIFVYINYIKLYIYLPINKDIRFRSPISLLFTAKMACVARLALALQGEATQCFSIDGEVGCKIDGILKYLDDICIPR